MMVSGCSENYIQVKPPAEYLQPTPYPENPPTTYGEAILAIPFWRDALDAANADKAAIVEFYKRLGK